MKKYAIIVAGGKGLRMGSHLPKQFIPVAGLPLLMHTLTRFKQAIPEVELILVLPESHQSYWKELCNEYHFLIEHQVVNGGETRFHSVLNGVKACTAPDALIAVHDGVRPLVAKSVIQHSFQLAPVAKAVIPVISVHETVRQLTPEGGSHTVPREQYVLVQTPQLFCANLLRRAYEQPYHTQFTDDASVVESLGHPVTLVEGNRENIKLTTPFDIQLAELLLRQS